MARNCLFLYQKNKTTVLEKFKKQLYVPPVDDEDDQAPKIPHLLTRQDSKELSFMETVKYRVISILPNRSTAPDSQKISVYMLHLKFFNA